MKLVSRFDYRNAEFIIRNRYEEALISIETLLSNSLLNLVLVKSESETQRNISTQIQKSFLDLHIGWEKEAPCKSVEGMKYDLIHSGLPVEIEIGHQRLVYADFFKFMADYSNQQIHAALMIVTNDPKKFGHSWHCSIESTRRKLESISKVYLVPTLLLGIDP